MGGLTLECGVEGRRVRTGIWEGVPERGASREAIWVRALVRSSLALASSALSAATTGVEHSVVSNAWERLLTLRRTIITTRLSHGGRHRESSSAPREASGRGCPLAKRWPSIASWRVSRRCVPADERSVVVVAMRVVVVGQQLDSTRGGQLGKVRPHLTLARGCFSRSFGRSTAQQQH